MKESFGPGDLLIFIFANSIRTSSKLMHGRFSERCKSNNSLFIGEKSLVKLTKNLLIKVADYLSSKTSSITGSLIHHTFLLTSIFFYLFPPRLCLDRTLHHRITTYLSLFLLRLDFVVISVQFSFITF